MFVMRCAVVAALAVGSVLAASAARADRFNVVYESPGVHDSFARFDYVGVEDFSGRSSGNFTTDFGTSAQPIRITGLYSNVTILNANRFGGAGGAGQFASTASAHLAYAVSLSAVTNDAAQTSVPITYFGFWLSALDLGNQVHFYRGGSPVFSYGPADVSFVVGACPNDANLYCDNPARALLGHDATEPFVFVNFHDTNPLGFDQVVFDETLYNGAQYESDNHTVGFHQSRVVPEPSSLAILGVALAGFAIPFRRRAARAAASLSAAHIIGTTTDRLFVPSGHRP